MTPEDLQRRFEQLTVWKSGDQRAPHKPLLVLYALGQLRRGRRLLPYREVDERLRALLIDFGPPRKRHHPEYPFWRLQNDNVWEVKDAADLTRRKSNTDPLKSELAEKNVSGGFPNDVFDTLRSSPEQQATIARRLVNEHFPTSLHEEILAEVGLDDIVGSTLRRKSRDPSFRPRVLRAYRYKCAVCGFDLKLGRSILGLEAAHIKWHQAGGSDTEQNGVALCSIHHKLFDKGALHINARLLLQVSEDVHGSDPHLDRLLARQGQKITAPQDETYYPKPESISWHVREVFRG